ncbi:NAD(P)-binding protein [Kitasatospora brasiliensis]|uniref:NAD(P)-binding protein n=1 Tax=Kitasatospora brasiliensis TaxID=3058040 RepID=UPI0029308317|nr:NAD(P)-binding protein [Kitasatospora sp. K002]
MSARRDAVVVGAGFAGTLVAHRLGAQGWRVLALEAGRAAPTGAQAATAHLAGGGGPPTSPYPHSPDAPSPDVTDLSGLPDGGFTATGHLRQYGPLPYASGYLRANGGTGLLWTGVTPRMHPEDSAPATSATAATGRSATTTWSPTTARPNGNPSLTMAALALRSAERMHRDLLELHRPAAVPPPAAGTPTPSSSSPSSLSPSESS